MRRLRVESEMIVDRERTEVGPRRDHPPPLFLPWSWRGPGAVLPPSSTLDIMRCLKKMCLHPQGDPSANFSPLTPLYRQGLQ